MTKQKKDSQWIFFDATQRGHLTDEMEIVARLDVRQFEVGNWISVESSDRVFALQVTQPRNSNGAAVVDEGQFHLYHIEGKRYRLRRA